METSDKFEKLTQLVGEAAACDILNDLIAQEYDRQTPDADFEKRNMEWESFCARYTGAAADELITDDIITEYENL